MIAKKLMRNAVGLNSRINELAEQVRDWKYLKNVIDEPEVNDIYNEVRDELLEAIHMKRDLEAVIMDNNNADQRAILRQRYFDGATWAGIADELNDTVEWVKEQTIGVEVEMNNITREKAAKIAAELFGTGRYEYTAGRNSYYTWSAWDAQGREWKFQRDVSIEGPDDAENLNDETCQKYFGISKAECFANLQKKLEIVSK